MCKWKGGRRCRRDHAAYHRVLEFRREDAFPQHESLRILSETPACDGRSELGRSVPDRGGSVPVPVPLPRSAELHLDFGFGAEGSGHLDFERRNENGVITLLSPDPKVNECAEDYELSMSLEGVEGWDSLISFLQRSNYSSSTYLLTKQ